MVAEVVEETTTEIETTEESPKLKTKVTIKVKAAALPKRKKVDQTIKTKSVDRIETTEERVALILTILTNQIKEILTNQLKENKTLVYEI